MDGFAMGDDAYSTLEEIRKDLRDMRQALVKLAEVQVQQRADRSVFDQYRIDNEADKAEIRSQMRSTASRVNVMSGAAVAIAFVIPLLFQWQPWQDKRPAEYPATAITSEKRQGQNPPLRLPQQEGS